MTTSAAWTPDDTAPPLRGAFLSGIHGGMEIEHTIIAILWLLGGIATYNYITAMGYTGRTGANLVAAILVWPFAVLYGLAARR